MMNQGRNQVTLLKQIKKWNDIPLLMTHLVFQKKKLQQHTGSQIKWVGGL